MKKSGFAKESDFQAHKDKDWRVVHAIWPNIKYIDWGKVTGRPGTYPPSPHTHVWVDITDFATYLDQAVKEASSPLFANLNLGAAPSIRQLSGALTFQTNEGVDTRTYVDIKGKGAQYGSLRIYDQDDAEYIQVRSMGGRGYIGTDGANPLALRLQGTIPQNIECWYAIPTGNPYFYLYGWHVTDTDWMRMRVEADGDALIEAENNLNIIAGGGEINFGDENLTTTGSLTVDDLHSIGQMDLDAVIEDKISLYDNRLGGATMYGFGVEASCLYYKAPTSGYHRWYIGANADGGVSDKMELSATALTIWPNVGIGKVPTCELDVEGTVQVSTLTASQLLGTGADKELKSLTTVTGLTIGHVLKATGAAAIAFQANNLGGLSDITLGTPTEASLLVYNQGGGFWYAGKPEYDIRYKSYDIEWEFWTASPPSPWVYGPISGGSASGVAASSHHPGSIGAYSGTAANSGYYWIAANNNLILSGTEQADFVFKTPAAYANRMVRFGFQDSITIVLPTDGAYLDLNGRYLTGKTRKAGVGSTTGTGYNTNANTWYRGRIIVNSDATLVTFLLYDAAGNQLWTNTLATNIPTAATGFGALGYYTVAADGTHIITMDLAYLVCARGLVR